MADRFIDVDAFLEEQDANRKPPTVRALGKEWTLPLSPPADAMLRAQRFLVQAIDARDRLKQLGPDDEIPADLKEAAEFKFEDHARALLGSDNFDALLAGGLRHDGLQYLVQRAMDLHMNGGAGGGSPNRAARRKAGQSSSKTSSTTGRSSRQGSKGNTGSS